MWKRNMVPQKMETDTFFACDHGGRTGGRANAWKYQGQAKNQRVKKTIEGHKPI